VGDNNDEAGPSNAAMGAEEPEREYRELGEDEGENDEEQRREVERRERRLRRARDAANPEHAEADLVGDNNDEAGPSNATMGAERPEREYRELRDDY